jgi:hypothetical protein
VRRVLGLPRKTQIDVMIAIGFPADGDPLRPKLRKPMAEVASFNCKQPGESKLQNPEIK